jgi:hypothetical protein
MSLLLGALRWTEPTVRCRRQRVNPSHTFVAFLALDLDDVLKAGRWRPADWLPFVSPMSALSGESR